MNKSQIWYGFLEAGKRSSAVVVDPKLKANSDEKIYVFNLNRKEILEYKKDIVQSKLRELTAEENTILSELKSSYEAALKQFNNTHRTIASTSSTTKEQKPTAKKDDNLESLEIDLDLEADLDLEED